MVLKKLRKSRITAILANYIIRLYITLIFSTCKFVRKEDSETKNLLKSRQVIFSIWHSRIFIFPKLNLPKITAVVSTHGDGEFIANLLESYGHKTTRGSSGRGGLNAMRGLLKTLKQGRGICITPDGPKGPRYKINGNITALAAKFGLPVIPLCFSASSAVVLNTWDKFIIPLPFSKIYIELGKPIYFKGEASGNNEILAEEMFNQMINLDKKSSLKVDY